MDVDELTKLLTPSEERITAVTQWLEEYGLDQYQWDWTLNRDMLVIRMPAFEVANLLLVDYDVFEHESGARYVGTLGKSLHHPATRNPCLLLTLQDPTGCLLTLHNTSISCLV